MSALLTAVAGLVLLIVGAELLVRGGTRVAAWLGISPIVIGLTIVAVGTSAPELAVGIDAALQGNGSLAVGNIAGTNAFNILFILGLSALLDPLAIELRTIRFDLPVMVAAALALTLSAWDLVLTRAEGVLLVLAALAFTVALIRLARREGRTAQTEYTREFAASARRDTGELLASLGALLAGIVIIVLGADLLVDGAVALARLLGVSDALIGLTIVAMGTSAPELVTTVISTIRRSRDIAVGNLLGSSVYNILFILGVTCIVPPAGIPVERALVRVDLPLMTGVALVCVPVFMSGRRVSRVEGGVFVAVYLAYLSYLLATRT